MTDSKIALFPNEKYKIINSKQTDQVAGGVFVDSDSLLITDEQGRFAAIRFAWPGMLTG